MNAPSASPFEALRINYDDLEVVKTVFTDEYLLTATQGRRLDTRSLISGEVIVFNPDAHALSIPRNDYATLLTMNTMLAGEYIAGTAFVFGARDKDGRPTKLDKNTITGLIMGWEKFTKKHFSHPDY